MTTVVLHIGVHKTGTSSIQETLVKSRGVLAGRGIMVPSVLPANHSNFVHDAFSDAPETYHANRARGLDRETVVARAGETLAALGREVAERRPATVVLSAEDACTLKPAEVARLQAGIAAHLAPSAVRVVLYTRHPVSYVTSAVQENVKGNGLTLERAKAIHIGGSHERYRRILTTWGAAFGEEALTVRAMEVAAARPEGLVGDFLAVLGTGREGIAEVRRNEGISDEILGFLAERNAAGAPRLEAGDARILFALRGNRASVLSEAERQAVWERALPDMEFLAERHGILYEPARPERGDVAARRERHEEFRSALEAVLPRLSPDLATELADRFVLPLPLSLSLSLAFEG